MKTGSSGNPLISASILFLAAIISPSNSIGSYLWKTPSVPFTLVLLVLAFCVGVLAGSQKAITTILIDKRLSLRKYGSICQN